MFQEGLRAAPGEAHAAPAAMAPSSAVAQILATEHWSLLATRGMTWSEVMSRISIHLAVSSAALVVLALVAQATGFGTPFRIMSIGLASAVLVLGTLTHVRVHLASAEDHALVAGMNRLRAAYPRRRGRRHRLPRVRGRGGAKVVPGAAYRGAVPQHSLTRQARGRPSAR
jgi:hypothetical protein